MIGGIIIMGILMLLFPVGNKGIVYLSRLIMKKLISIVVIILILYGMDM